MEFVRTPEDRFAGLERFSRVVTANTGLPDARGVPDEVASSMHQLYDSIPALPPSEMAARLRENKNGAGFMYWIKFCAEYPDFIISEVVSMSAMSKLTVEQIKAYDAPFPDESYKAGAREFPSLVPIFPDGPEISANRKAWEVLRQFEKPFLTAFSDKDLVTAGGYKRFQEEVPGAQNQKHVTIEGAGHFLQEDSGDELANTVINFIRDNHVD